MELDQAKQHINEVVWWRFKNARKGIEPEMVRIVTVPDHIVYVTLILEGWVPTDELIPADPDELHFEKSGFEEM